MDIETLVTIIFTVLFLIIGATRKKKQVVEKVNTEVDFDNALHFETQNVSIASTAAVKSSGNSNFKKSNAHSKIISPPKIQKIDPMPNSFDRGGLIEKDNIKEVVPHFNLREAVIYSEILKPKYF